MANADEELARGRTQRDALEKRERDVFGVETEREFDVECDDRESLDWEPGPDPEAD